MLLVPSDNASLDQDSVQNPVMFFITDTKLYLYIGHG